MTSSAPHYAPAECVSSVFPPSHHLFALSDLYHFDLSTDPHQFNFSISDAYQLRMTELDNQDQPTITSFQYTSVHYAPSCPPDGSPYNNSPLQPGSWQMYRSLTQDQQRGQPTETAAGHARQLSNSTISSIDPASPHLTTTALPYIVDTDIPSFSNQYFGDEGFLKSEASDDCHQGFTHPVLSTTPLALAVPKEMTTVQGPTAAEDVPDFISSRRSNSSHGQSTPNTPQTGAEEADGKELRTTPQTSRRPGPSITGDNNTRVASSDYQRPPVELFRTESAACQDELFNPANFDAPASSQPPVAKTRPKDLLSPLGNLVNERVRTANSVRSKSPTQDINRERSPFRQGSELAPPPNYPRSPMPSAASQRQRQKEQADRKEYEAHQPTLRRKVTETISPKDAFLETPDLDQDNPASLFNDVIPEGYQKHFGGSESYPSNYISGTNQSMGPFVPLNASNTGGFRGGGVDLNNFLASPLTTNNNGFAQQFSTQKSDPTPEFPAQLTSMESSISDNPPASSQDSIAPPPIRRPADTSASSGTYTCTFPACTLRFDAPAKLQKHKREAHQPIVIPRKSITPASEMNDEDDESGSDDDDGEGSLGSGLTSSELLARNSQAGPHKCARLNPTTGKPCNSIFSRPYDLTRHEDTIHNKQKQKVRCQYCREEKSFSRNDALTRHMRVVHPEIDFQGKRGRNF